MTALRDELLRLMPVESNNDWGPSPIVCRWCGCWLKYGDRSAGAPVEAHDGHCFAVAHLGRPAMPAAEQAQRTAAEQAARKQRRKP